MNLRQLRAIQAVAELGSVTAAANRLHLTQSAVSRMIAALEAELGLKLFERYRQRLLLSNHAVSLIARAGKIVTELQDLEATARAAVQGRTDRLRVVAVLPFLQNIIPAAVAERLGANPKLSVKLEIARRVDISDWISRRDFDIAVISLPVDRPEVEIEPLPPVHAVAVLPRGHRLATLKRISLRQIYDGRSVVHSTGPLMRFALDRALASRNGRSWTGGRGSLHCSGVRSFGAAGSSAPRMSAAQIRDFFGKSYMGKTRGESTYRNRRGRA